MISQFLYDLSVILTHSLLSVLDSILCSRLCVFFMSVASFHLGSAPSPSLIIAFTSSFSSLARTCPQRSPDEAKASNDEQQQCLQTENIGATRCCASLVCLLPRLVSILFLPLNTAISPPQRNNKPAATAAETANRRCHSSLSLAIAAVAAASSPSPISHSTATPSPSIPQQETSLISLGAHGSSNNTAT